MTPPSAPTAADTASCLEDVSTQLAYLALARRLRQAHTPVIGLWPVSPETEFADVPILLAKAMASLSLQVGLLKPDHWRHQAPTANGPITTMLSEGVESIRPSAPPSNVSAGVEQTLAEVQGRYDRVLLDLSGLDVVAVKEVAMMPEVGTVLFLVSGELNEFGLARLQRQLPQDRLLGAVFVDQESGRYGR